MHLGSEAAEHVVVAFSFATSLLEIEPARHDQQDVGMKRTQLRPFHPVRWLSCGPREKVTARRGDELGHPVSGDIRRVEPLEREHAGPRSIGNFGAHRADASLHVRDAILSLLYRPGRATDVANAREDGGEVVRVEGENLSSHNRSDELTLRHRTNVADPLGEDEIGLERGECIDIDLIHAAMIAQCRAHSRIDLPARQALETRARARKPRPVGDARGVVATVRDPDQPVLETERADNLGGAGK
jgi:hypothetical protein